MNGQMLEALELLQATLPEAKADTFEPSYYYLALTELVTVFHNLDRNQEAYETATEVVAFTDANFGMEDVRTFGARAAYAKACARLDRLEEATSIFEDLLTTQTRIYGPDHPMIHKLKRIILSNGIPAPDEEGP